MAKSEKSSKKRIVKVDAIGRAYVNASFNNIIVTLTNNNGQVVSWSSAGKMGFKGSKKNTPYAAQMAAQDASKVAYDAGLRKVKVYIKGPGAGRESAIPSRAISKYIFPPRDSHFNISFSQFFLWPVLQRTTISSKE